MRGVCGGVGWVVGGRGEKVKFLFVTPAEGGFHVIHRQPWMRFETFAQRTYRLQLKKEKMRVARIQEKKDNQ